MVATNQSFTRRKSVKSSPNTDEMVEVLRRTTPESYHGQILGDSQGSEALYRAMAKTAATVADKAFQAQQGLFYLPYPTQGEIPATSLIAATFDVDIGRTFSLDQGRIIEIAAMQLFGPQGRTYLNTTRVEWLPFDPNPVKTVTFISEDKGSAGNLDHLGNADGLIANPDGTPATSIVGIQVQGDRAGIEASITVSPGTQSKLVDNGLADQFIENDVGLYVELLDSANTAQNGKFYKIVGFEAPGVEDPVGSARIPNRIIVNDGPTRAQIVSAQQDDGGVFTDQTLAAKDGTTIDDVDLLPASPLAGDAYYFGGSTVFSQLEINISTVGVGDHVLAYEYFNGATWAGLGGLSDGTNGYRVIGVNVIQFVEPLDWASTTINSVPGFYVRVRVDSVTSVTALPAASQVFVFAANTLIAEVGDAISGTLGWAIRDWVDLGFVLRRIEAPSGGNDDNLRLLGDERGVGQISGESDDQFRQRAARLLDTVSPDAINRAINRELAPFGFRGLAVDVSDFDGFFLDLDALDYYEPGDPPDSPENNFKLLLSAREAYGWFFVFVPNVALGEIVAGSAFDGGPESVIGTTQIVSAFDVGAFDGSLAGINDPGSVYGNIYQAVDKIRAGGVGFTMILDEALNAPACTP